MKVVSLSPLARWVDTQNQMGFNGFELGAEGPLSKKDKSHLGKGANPGRAYYLVNYRYSTVAVFNATIKLVLYEAYVFCFFFLAAGKRMLLSIRR